MSVLLESIDLCIKYVNAQADISIIIETINYSIDVEVQYDKLKLSRYR